MPSPLHCLPTMVWFCLLTLGTADAQDAAKVPADLKFTEEISTRFHIVAHVTLHLTDGRTETFQYDRYPSKGLRPGVERVKRTEGVFARRPGGVWMKSDDWAATGTAVDEAMAGVLDTDANIVGIPFRPPTNHDTAQGATVWLYVGATPQATATEYTFRESRQHPRPGGAYPEYTFLKAPHDTDGRLFLCGLNANLRDNAGLIPVTMRLTYLIPIPPGTRVQIFDKDTGKEKVNTVTGSNSGFEMTTPTSEPPATP